ncbi:MAG: bifunctional DedA family/phosphatase PAP2 family protein [Candidatus Paceibacterota bacterium]|jgi:undecaprenyl-diphosphatase
MNFINNLLPTVAGLGVLGYWVVFLFSFGESLAFVGNLLPGSIIAIFAGFLVSQGIFDFGDLIWFVAIGAILGDVLSYYLGTKGTKFFKDENKFLKLSHLEKGKEFFKRHGNKSIFLGRFIGFIRPVTPFIAGLSRMDKKAFIFWDIISGFAWALVHIGIGYFFGYAMPTVEKWITRFGFFSLILILVAIIVWIFSRRSGQLLQMSKSIFSLTEEIFWGSSLLKRFRAFYPKFFLFFKERFNREKLSGLPLTSFFVSSLIVLFLIDYFSRAGFTSNFIYFSDFYTEHAMRLFRNDFFVNFFLWVTTLGEVKFVLSLAVTASVILFVWGKRNYIVPLWYSIMASEFFVYFGKMVVARPRPEGIVPIYFENDFSFPSGHSAISIAFYGFISYLFWKLAKNWKYKAHAFFVGSLLILAIGFSRLYLGVHFLSDVLSGYLIGALFLVSAIFISECILKKNEYAGFKQKSYSQRKAVLAVILVAELIFYGYYATHFNFPLNNQAIRAIPVEEAE